MSEAKKAEAPTTTEGKPWYKSLTIQGLIAAVVVLCVLPRMGIEIDAAYNTEIMVALVGWVVTGLRNSTGTGLTIK
jgi:hypothetical protein